MTAEPSPIILVVEDDDAIRAVIGDLLEIEGFAFRLEPSADTALHRLDHTEEVPRVILLDLSMPGLPAARFIESVRQRPALAATRIVLMTASAPSAVPEHLDVDAVLFKPFAAEMLIDMVIATAGTVRRPSGIGISSGDAA